MASVAAKKNNSFPSLGQHDKYTFPAEVTGARIVVEWQCTSTDSLCDLDVNLYLYDEKANLVEKLDLDSALSADGAVELEGDIRGSKGHSEENFHVKLPLVNRKISSILVFIDGGSKNFQHAKNLRIRCMQEDISDEDNDGNIMRYLVTSSMQCDTDRKPLFVAPLSVSLACCADQQQVTQCLVGLVLYRGEWGKDLEQGSDKDSSAAAPAAGAASRRDWICHSIAEPLRVTSLQEKKTLCYKHVVTTVPALYKYCPRIFPSVNSICNSLSSNALPDLKKIFLANDGLPIRDFTRTLFRSLCTVNRRILDPFEAAYTVAMCEELFCQIDFNGDGVVDWEEFTTFCIFTGLLELAEGDKCGNALEGGSGSEEAVRFVVEGGRREQDVLSHTALVSLVLHVPATKRLLLLQKKALVVDMVDEHFRRVATLDPTHLLPSPPPEQARKSNTNRDSIKVYAVCYISCAMLYAYSASDYSIVMCKEIFVPGVGATFSLHRRIVHAFLHVKLCWCEHSRVLCSVAVDNIIYGWSIDSADPLFDMSRHSNTVTDMVALDQHGLVGTCSLDKKIILWSQRSQRVKAVLRGHKRGVRGLHAMGDVLISAGFECDAKTWDLVSLEPALTLRGHRAPITVAKMMIAVPDCHRAISVDESGEFRLWDVLVKTGFDTGQFATALHVFSVPCEKSLDRVMGLVLPFEADFSHGNYSNIIACSSTLVHFQPEAKVTEFVAPSGMCYSDANRCLITCIGKTLRKYDMFTGTYQSTYDDLADCEVTCFVVDRDGRRIFVGNSKGQILLVNFVSGQLVQAVDGHQKEVTCLQLLPRSQGPGGRGGVEMLYSGSNDGQLRLFHVSGGLPVLQHSNEHAMSDGTPISHIVPLLAFQLVLATTLSRCWGLFHAVTLKRVLLVHEATPISGLALLGGGGGDDKEAEAEAEAEGDSDPSSPAQQARAKAKKILTFALAVSTEILIISLDLVSLKRVISHKLTLADHVYFSNIATLKYPQNSVNYSTSEQAAHLLTPGTDTLVATTDDGYIYVWDMASARRDSLAKFELKFSMLKTLRRVVNQRVRMGNLFDKKQLLPAASGASSTSSAAPAAASSSSSSSPHHVASRSVLKKQEEDAEAEKPLFPQPALHWQGHTDVIVNLVILAEHGCFVTNSLDGYHHLWNLQQARLGFMPLPNLHPKMIKDDSEVFAWKFTMEKKTVSSQHEKFSRRLVNHILREEESLLQTHPRMSTRKARRNRLTRGPKGLKVASSPKSESSSNATACSRTTLLQSLHDTEPLVIDTSSIDNNEEEEKEEEEGEEEEGEEEDEEESLPFPLRSSSSSTVSLSLHQLSSPVSVAQQAQEQEHNIAFSPIQSKGTVARGNKMCSSVGLKQNEATETRPSLPLLSPRQLPPPPPMSSTATTGGSKQLVPSPIKQKQVAVAAVTKKSTQQQQQRGGGGGGGGGGGRGRGGRGAGARGMWNTCDDLSSHVVHAFTESSISSSINQGLFGSKEGAILRGISKDKDKAEGYSRVQPRLELKNAHLSTAVRFPTLDISKAEMNFGAQKGMYQNANKHLSSQLSLSPQQKANAKHAACRSRIDYNVGHIGSMLQETHPSHDEDVEFQTQTQQQKQHAGSNSNSNSSVLPPPPAPPSEESKVAASGLDSERMRGLTLKLARAEVEAVPTWESRAALAQQEKQKQRREKQRAHQSSQTGSKGTALKISEAAIELKLYKVIVKFHEKHQASDDSKQQAALRVDRQESSSVSSRPLSESLPVPVPAKGGVKEAAERERPLPSLKARDLMPSYKMVDVTNFLRIFYSIDTDYTGVLDVREWVDFFTTLRASVDQHYAKLMFYQIDDNGDGVLSIQELLPLIFTKASKEQLVLIEEYMEYAISKQKMYINHSLTEHDMQCLFEYYDTDMIAFVKVGVIRKKIMALELPRIAHDELMYSLKNIESDEMFSEKEFIRIFKRYLDTTTTAAAAATGEKKVFR